MYMYDEHLENKLVFDFLSVRSVDPLTMINFKITYALLHAKNSLKLTVKDFSRCIMASIVSLS